MVGRVMRLAVIVGVVWCALPGHDAAANPCGGPTFAFGNAGYGAGYSIAGVRGPGWGYGWGWGGCGPRWHCGPRVGGWPDCGGGWRFGWPGFGWGGCHGVRRWSGCESIYLSVPACGGGSFFSGCVTPFGGCGPFFGGWPTNWYPGCAVGAWGSYPCAVPAPVGVGPQFGPAGILPFLGAATSGGRGAPVVATRSRTAVRLVNDASRRRAARLVALGDRHLRETRAGEPARARAAADAYRRAAAAAPDDPDIRIREALALVALGDAHAADAALVRAAALDGRLAAAPVRRPDLPPDRVFGDAGPAEPAPLVARGQAVLREIGAADAAAVAWLAARWSDRWAGNSAAVVSR